MTHDKYSCLCGGGKFKEQCEQIRRKNNINHRFCIMCGKRLQTNSYGDLNIHMQCFDTYQSCPVQYNYKGEKLS